MISKSRGGSYSKNLQPVTERRRLRDNPTYVRDRMSKCYGEMPAASGNGGRKLSSATLDDAGKESRERDDMMWSRRKRKANRRLYVIPDMICTARHDSSVHASETRRHEYSIIDTIWISQPCSGLADDMHPGIGEHKFRAERHPPAKVRGAIR
ncbi:hypothetical protein L249_4860 [Ophiocordyceps polyrhachis-furcata BCC 54312]|uniref:Uncharacterized protein n=1 Tax=Ophiocordyceps polyrhachis-furcata BCC 54312 TaxID=1330021 RepID=A0A367L2F1_9HYPO|nr:hypothetical protein L249_4860 [Ophiocordyceps polyrhachis-furcata BCC 54312]